MAAESCQTPMGMRLISNLKHFSSSTLKPAHHCICSGRSIPAKENAGALILPNSCALEWISEA
jgi:hypothetical protein